MSWVDVAAETEIPARGARRLLIGATPVGLFRAGDGAIFALVDRCPHKNGPLSDGVVHGRAVACPLHNWRISLETGEALGADKGCTPTIPLELRAGRVWIDISALAQAA